jgi:hypothetical protein
MNEVDRRKRNETRIGELFPTFGARLLGVIRRGGCIRPRIQDAWRSPEARLEAFNSVIRSSGSALTTSPDPTAEKKRSRSIFSTTTRP